LDAQLASRLASGLVAYIGPPEAETRRKILRSKAASGGIALPDACLEALAERPVESVRDLVAGLNQVVAHATLLKRPITPELVREALATVTVPGRRRSLDEIVKLVAQTYALSVAELRSRSRKRHVVRPRQLAMYLCRRFTDASLKEIGRALERDHTSVIYAIDVVERRATEHPPLRYQLETLASRLGR
jgi:chromosomal replication initiator protein